MRVNLTDKVALVTGSAHRVGRAIALELARVGVHILVHYNS
ncbi:MAG: short-chain dehydrogenase, partial [Phototrophicales bacterium]